MCLGFYCILKKCSKMSQKTDFWVHFERHFTYALLRPTDYAQSPCQKKDLITIHNPGKFHCIASVVAKL